MVGRIAAVRPYALLTLSALLLTGCCIHQEPKPPVEVEPPSDTRPFRLSLVFDRDLPLLGEYVYDGGNVARSRSRGPEDALLPHDARYTVNAYGISRGGEVVRRPDASFVFTRQSAAGLDTVVDIAVPEGDYRLIVFVDHVDAGTKADKYYDTSDFEEIILRDRGRHSGSNPWREAFVGYAETSVVSRAPDGSPSRSPVDGAAVAMRRPMAKYRFISTDLRRFIEQSARSRAGREAAADGKGGEPSRAPALGDYRVTMHYTRYMPCSFNMFTDRPADSWTGVSYESTIRPVGDDEAEVAFDYVFVNGSETAVTVAMEVHDTDGTLLARIPAFEVPLRRSMETIVRGEFLTTRAGGAIGISPGFDGSFDIEIK